jgi:hypothetical protein
VYLIGYLKDGFVGVHETKPSKERLIMTLGTNVVSVCGRVIPQKYKHFMEMLRGIPEDNWTMVTSDDGPVCKAISSKITEAKTAGIHSVSDILSYVHGEIRRLIEACKRQILLTVEGLEDMVRILIGLEIVT